MLLLDSLLDLFVLYFYVFFFFFRRPVLNSATQRSFTKLIFRVLHLEERGRPLRRLNRRLPLQRHALHTGMCAVVKVQKKKKTEEEKKNRARKSMLTVATRFPLQRGFCLAFVLIQPHPPPSPPTPPHRRMQARGPPTSSCQKDVLGETPLKYGRVS